MEKVARSSPGSTVSDTYPMFIEPTITRVLSGFSGYIWLDAKRLHVNIPKVRYSDMGNKAE